MLLLMNYLGPIICVEDDEDDVLLIKIALKRLHLPNRLFTFKTAEEALQFLDKVNLPPFFILSDYMLPGMNGRDFCKRLYHAGAHYSNVPFVVLTALRTLRMTDFRDCGFIHGVFYKPQSFQELQVMMKYIITYWQTHQKQGEIAMG